MLCTVKYSLCNYNKNSLWRAANLRQLLFCNNIEFENLDLIGLFRLLGSLESSSIL